MPPTFWKFPKRLQRNFKTQTSVTFSSQLQLLLLVHLWKEVEREKWYPYKMIVKFSYLLMLRTFFCKNTNAEKYSCYLIDKDIYIMFCCFFLFLQKTGRTDILVFHDFRNCHFLKQVKMPKLSKSIIFWLMTQYM